MLLFGGFCIFNEIFVEKVGLDASRYESARLKNVNKLLFIKLFSYRVKVVIQMESATR